MICFIFMNDEQYVSGKEASKILGVINVHYINGKIKNKLKQYVHQEIKDYIM